MRINLSLKYTYRQQFYHEKWKKQFYFEFTIVYLTKTVSKFIGEYFPLLKINENLESQILIIFLNVFIGNQVGTKTYYLLAKKYIRNVAPKLTNQNFKQSFSNTKKSSFIEVFKPTFKCISEILHSRSSTEKKKIIF